MALNIDYLTLRAFLNENKDFLINSRIQKIRQTTARDLVIVLRNNGESRKLYINILPDIYHICFMSENTEKKRSLTYPKNPPMFCMLLRKYLDNAKITAVNQPYYERIIEFELEAKTDFDANKKYILAVELMGKHSNIVLYSRENSVIVGCAHNVGENKSKIREMYGGIPYVYPPASKGKKDFLRYFGAVNYDTMPDDFLGISKSFANLCRGRNIEEIKDYLELKNIKPALGEGGYSIFAGLLSGEKEYTDSVNEMIDRYYAKEQSSRLLRVLKSDLSAVVLSRYKKVKNSISKIEFLRHKRDNTERYKLYGELLTAYAYMNSNYVKEIALADYNTGEEVTIPLDETLTMIDNAKWYFKLYTKAKRTGEKTAHLMESLQESKEYLEGVMYSIEKADSTEILEDIKEELQPESVAKKNTRSESEKFEINGYTVFVGRNNRQNDYIISKLAKDEDVWFHIKGSAGSHVLLKITDKTEPDENVIFECCKLAKKYSSVPENEKYGVIYTKRKYIRKPPGANPGYVTYKNEKEIYL